MNAAPGPASLDGRAAVRSDVARACACRDRRPCAARFVVVTGGPCAGKTAVLEVVRRRSCEHVVVLPEAAGIVFGGGFPRHTTVPGREAAQLAIFHVQDQLEQLARGEGAPSLVVCDRGVLDGAAYWPGSREEFFARAGTTRAAALARYDAVIHLRTPPAGCGYDQRNPLRIESAAEARACDERILAAWEGHPRRFVVESCEDFLEKAARALRLIDAEFAAASDERRGPSTS